MMHATINSRNLGTGACLDDLLASRFLPRRPATRIWSVSGLPSRLEQCARKLAPGTEWRAYSDDGRIFFAIARAHAGASAAQAHRAIDVYFLDDNAAVYCAGLWEYDDSHGWWLDAVLDLSYDCDHGWWFDDLTDPCDPMERRSPRDRRVSSDRRVLSDRRGDMRQLAAPGACSAGEPRVEKRAAKLRRART